MCVCVLQSASQHEKVEVRMTLLPSEPAASTSTLIHISGGSLVNRTVFNSPVASGFANMTILNISSRIGESIQFSVTVKDMYFNDVVSHCCSPCSVRSHVWMRA